MALTCPLRITCCSIRRATYISCTLHDALSIKNSRHVSIQSDVKLTRIRLPARCVSYMYSLQVLVGSLSCQCNYSYSYCIGFNFTIPLIENCSKITNQNKWNNKRSNEYSQSLFILTECCNSGKLHAIIRDYGTLFKHLIWSVRSSVIFADHRLRARSFGVFRNNKIYGIYSGYSATGSRIAGMEIQVFRNENSSQTNVTRIIPIILIPVDPKRTRPKCNFVPVLVRKKRRSGVMHCDYLKVRC